MKYWLTNQPRIFDSGSKIMLKDVGYIELEVSETFGLKHGNKIVNDISRKNWGYYLTNSINFRLDERNYFVSIIRNDLDHLFIVLVDSKRIDDFEQYLLDSNQIEISRIGK